MRPEQNIPRTVLVTTLTVVSVIASIGLLYLLRGPISWLIIAAFLAVAVAGPIKWCERWMSRRKAILLVYVVLLLIPTLLALIMLPPIVRAASNLVDQAPDYAGQLQKAVTDNETLNKLDDDFHIVQQIQKSADKLPEQLGNAASWLGDLGLGIVNSAFAAVTILIFSVFLVANGRSWVEALLAYGPGERRDRLRAVLDRMADAVGSYIAGALFQAVVAGLLTWVVLLILGVPFAAPLAVLVAVFDLIPMVGATIAAVVVGIVTLFHDFPTVTIIWVVWSIVYQQVENTVIQPRIQNRAVGIHPFAVMVAVLFGGTLFGVAGALLAVPFAAAVQIGLAEWWRWRAERQASLDEGSEPSPRDEPPAGQPTTA